jgi:hypothetical protein
MTTPTRERRDWTLLIFIIPIGIIFMLIAGQVAIRLIPIWSINAGMQSKLDPNNLPKQQSGIVQPVLPAILTPLGWLDTFLTPGAGSGDQNAAFPPFVILEPSATPVVTATPPPTTVTSPPTIPVTDSPTVVVTPPVTATKKPPVDTPTPPTPIVTNPPTSTAVPITSTPPILSILLTPPPPELGVNVPPDGNPASILPGTYTVVNISSNPVHVSNTPDGNYDLIFYEATAPGDPTTILLDQISIGISNAADGSSYYQVFNWGDNIPDTNTNVNFNTLPPDPSPLCTHECDNRTIPTSNLYPGASGPDPSTGVLIDVDTAPSAPPAGTYNYLVIVSPLAGAPDPAQVDSVVVTEVPTP